VGSSCNVCREADPRRAAILCYRPDGSGEELFAHGPSERRGNGILAGHGGDGGRVLGRPVDVIVGWDGALYVSDDYSGRVDRITYRSSP
jgi:hypothetical protein